MTFDDHTLQLSAFADITYNYSLPVTYKLKLLGKLFDKDDQLSKEVRIKVVGKISGVDKKQEIVIGMIFDGPLALFNTDDKEMKDYQFLMRTS